MIKRIVLNILDYIRWQVSNDKCTMEELRSIHDSLARNLEIDATAEDIAGHYGQTASNVKNVISRKMARKPKRRVYYSFADFARNAPKTWRRGNTAGNM